MSWPGSVHGREEETKAVHAGVQGGGHGAVPQGGKTAGEVARDLDLTETSVRAWIRQAEVDEGKGPPGTLTTSEREDLSILGD